MKVKPFSVLLGLFAGAIAGFLYVIFLVERFSQQKEPKIYILTRTSGRPEFFKACRKSILEQSYKNWEHIVSYDDVETFKYVSAAGDGVVPVGVDKLIKTPEMNCPYNLYNNNLLKRVPNGGWVLFLDDDGKLYNKESLKVLSKQIIKAEKDEKELIISLGDGKVNKKPKCWGMDRDEIMERMKKGGENWHFAKIDTSHICIQKTDKLAPWRYRCAGDAHFFDDNLKAGYEPFYNENVVISGNYLRYGGGKGKDI